MTEKPQEIPLSGENNDVRFGLLPHEYPVSQLYRMNDDPRAGAELTRDQNIALGEHARFHAAKRDFGSGLQDHIDLMIKGMKNGLSFIDAHILAVKLGPKPIQ